MERVGIIGGGEFGRALAAATARKGGEAWLWSRRPAAPPAPGVHMTDDLAALRERTLLFMAVPSPHVQAVARALGQHLDGRHYLVHVSRGLVGDELTTLTTLLRTVTPVRRVGVLAGPVVARSLAAGEPSGAIVGTRFPEVREAVENALASRDTRIEATDDVVGVEIASAMVGLFALGAGCVLGAGGGPAPLSVYLSRAMEEATRLGVHLGANARTFAGLAGMGDLIAAVAGDDRPEMRLGLALGRGEGLEGAAAAARAHIEGVRIGDQVVSFSEKRGLRMPISGLLADLAAGRMSPRDAASALAVGSRPKAPGSRQPQ